jgi:hypothetical protein
MLHGVTDEIHIGRAADGKSLHREGLHDTPRLLVKVQTSVDLLVGDSQEPGALDTLLPYARGLVGKLRAKCGQHTKQYSPLQKFAVRKGTGLGSNGEGDLW